MKLGHDRGMLVTFLQKLKESPPGKRCYVLGNETLSPEQWLRKDLKSYHLGSLIYGIASAPSFQGLDRDLIESFRQKRGFSALFLLEALRRSLF
jgi:hypothetical protein